MEYIVSYEEPYGFVLWCGGSAIGKYKSFLQLLNALKPIPHEVTFKYSAIERMHSLIEMELIR